MMKPNPELLILVFHQNKYKARTNQSVQNVMM